VAQPGTALALSSLFFKENAGEKNSSVRLK